MDRSKHGSNALWVEFPTGELRIIPIQWTDLQPRGDPPRIHGRAVLLDPEALLEVSAWVTSRRLEPGEATSPLEATICGGDKEQHDNAQAEPAGRAAPVVGQARSSGRDRRRQRRKEAKR